MNRHFPLFSLRRLLLDFSSNSIGKDIALDALIIHSMVQYLHINHFLHIEFITIIEDALN